MSSTNDSLADAERQGPGGRLLAASFATALTAVVLAIALYRTQSERLPVEAHPMMNTLDQQAALSQIPKKRREIRELEKELEKLRKAADP